MNGKPRCVVVTGRPGSGKTTLARKLADQLWMPMISRDAIKEGYVNTYGIRHDQLPADTNGVVTNLFFEIVKQHLLGKVSVVIDAAFQHGLWEPRISEFRELSDPIVIICSVDGMTAAKRHLERGLETPQREFFHGDRRVAQYRETGEFSPAGNYDPPSCDVPTVKVSTASELLPSLVELVKMIKSADARQGGAPDAFGAGEH